MLRTHTCGELNKKNVGQEVALAGWVHTRRDFGGVVFIDLRDRYGLTQITCNSEKNKEAWEIASTLRSESVILVKGAVAARPKTMINKTISSGEIEIDVISIEILSTADVLPFEISNEEIANSVNENLRLEYRFLDLRRPKLQSMLKAKDDLFTLLRAYFKQHNFVEVQTPILANSSPEGARDFLIPSRLYPGMSYALPQAPQQFKQLLMVGGVDRYFQIAPCFRDEDTRNDRAYGEFYQLDMEMSFATQEDIFAIMEPVMKEIVEKLSTKKNSNLEEDGSFRKIAWREAMERYGSDKPDLRYDFEITPVSSLLENCGFEHFEETLKNNGVIHALRVPGGAVFTRKVLDELRALAEKRGFAAYATVSKEEGGPKSSLSKFISDDTFNSLFAAAKAETGDLLILVAAPWRTACLTLGALRQECAKRLNVLDASKAAWCWVVDFPFYENSEIDGSLDFGHNPFSMPQGGHEAIDTKNPLDILAYQYDLVLNGYEVSSGAVRNHDPELLRKAFMKVGYEAEEVERRFGALMKAFRYGVPPHAGNAPGVDRLLMVLNDWDSIRDLYAFPKDGQGRDVLMNSPSVIDDEQLSELGLIVISKESAQRADD